MTPSKAELDRHEEWFIQHTKTLREMQARLDLLEQAMLETAAALREAGIPRGGSWSLPSPSEDSDPASPSAEPLSPREQEEIEAITPLRRFLRVGR